MSVIEKKTTVPITRPRFTEEGLTGCETRTQESTYSHADLMNELVPLKAKPVIPGRATVSMMEQFRMDARYDATSRTVGPSFDIGFKVAR